MYCNSTNTSLTKESTYKSDCIPVISWVCCAYSHTNLRLFIGWMVGVPSIWPATELERISAVLNSFHYTLFLSRVDGFGGLACFPCMGQLVEHCSVSAEATGSHSFEAPKNIFFGLTLQLLKLQYNCDGHIFISFDLIFLHEIHVFFLGC